ncbi:BZ3500_MvSof-1268-A1-R1_Chr8-1g09949 [Microbotryum saponariae]|uniref:BZ3500_MvSof-1268-A1-R1_Chr8-1g09949 protein n=1 Tax=Microbotryum saponariae TaxID=289078 RepID=A0A2X0KQ33_9BASI|nr:BZ3500_MvSof-1268-A1-R1_Chr8-1g09949 [Microbotryum saponariae]SDA08235.1 BZ3501_MvSof-1269-A2-R1_Chr8-1g09672 [Microbotryum saponariae]
MRDKGARHLPSGIAAAFGCRPRATEILRGIMRPNPVIEAGSFSKKRRLSKVITLEDDEDEDEVRKKMRISTYRHVEVFMCQIRQFHVSDQIDLLRSDQSRQNQKNQIRSDLI